MTQCRKQDHVPDTCAVRQQHHQTVDPDTATARGGHPVLKCPYEIVVEEHRLIIAPVFCRDLRVEASGLVLGIVQL